MGRPPKQTSRTRLSWFPRPTKWTCTLPGPRSSTSTAYPSVGVAATRRMKNPLHDAVTTPPSVEYVAVGSCAGGAVGGGVVTAVALVVVVVEGEGAGMVGAGPGACAAAGGGGSGRGRGAVAVEGSRAVVGGGPTSGPGGSSASACTTSRWATTGAGRSVTSPATTDVAVHTMAVAAAVVASQIPAVSNRRAFTGRGCLLTPRQGIRDG